MADVIKRNLLLKAEVAPRSLTNIEAYEIHFEPGQIGGLHLHPCPVAGYILSGTARMQIEGEQPKILPAGSAFFEPPLKRIKEFSNHSAQEPMVFLAYYLLSGDQPLIEMLEE
jgi:quercetin dioxygenase-like cupin family protein